LIFYCEAQRCLISADALWENGFGVVFPELDGTSAFDEVAATLDVIAKLDIQTVIPGHGAAFTDVAGALQRARTRLDGFVQSPTKHRWYAVKVLAMFWLMAQQRCAYASALAHLSSTRYMAQVAENLGASAQQVVEKALAEMVAKGQLILADGQLAVA
jgi:glyoxylase-like metal-dependent hydrolase (beta-lactamase superfamily II)